MGERPINFDKFQNLEFCLYALAYKNLQNAQFCGLSLILCYRRGDNLVDFIPLCQANSVSQASTAAPAQAEKRTCICATHTKKVIKRLKQKNNRPEILAPAGNEAGIIATINAGADAVYFGGTH